MGFFSSLGFGSGVSSQFSSSAPDIYLFRPITPFGALVEFWRRPGSAVGHGNIDTIFTGSGHLGLPDQHINGMADYTSLIPDIRLTTNNLPGHRRNQSPDQFQIRAYLYITAAGTRLRDNNSQVGERIRIYTASPGAAPELVSLNNNDTNSNRPGAGQFAILGEGWHLLLVQVTDATISGGFNLQIDQGGDGNFVNYTGPVYPEFPQFEVVIEDDDYELQPGDILVETGTAALGQLQGCPPLSL